MGLNLVLSLLCYNYTNKTKKERNEKIQRFIENETPIKKGDIVNIHNDLGKMVSGEVISITDKFVTVSVDGVKFKRKQSEIY